MEQRGYQQRVLAALATGRNYIVVAPTGSGKASLVDVTLCCVV